MARFDGGDEGLGSDTAAAFGRWVMLRDVAILRALRNARDYVTDLRSTALRERKAYKKSLSLLLRPLNDRRETTQMKTVTETLAASLEVVQLVKPLDFEAPNRRTSSSAAALDYRDRRVALRLN